MSLGRNQRKALEYLAECKDGMAPGYNVAAAAGWQGDVLNIAAGVWRLLESDLIQLTITDKGRQAIGKEVES